MRFARISSSRASISSAPLTPPTVHDLMRSTIRLTNRGNPTASGLSVRVDIPRRLKQPRVILGGRPCRVGPSCALCAGRTARGGSTILAATGKPSGAGRYSFVATVRAQELDLDTADNRAVYVADARRCTVSGSAKTDTLRGTARRDRICGLGGADTLRGLAGRDELVGHGGSDVLDGGRGQDAVWGGPGRIVYSSATERAMS